MLHPNFPQDSDCFTVKNNPASSSRKLLPEIVHENHFLFTMERPNNLMRLLFEFYTLGASKEQLLHTYQKGLADIQVVGSSTTTKIDRSNWKYYLGDSKYYKQYFLFFEKELHVFGVEETLNRYFYSMNPSIGSQLQPIVQLAFGMEQNLPEIISQALAYYAASYLDVSDFLCFKDTEHPTVDNDDHLIANKIIFDMAHVDQRFDGRIKGPQNTLQSTIKVLLKSQSDLLKSYMKTWFTSTQQLNQNGDDSRLEMLVYTALSLVDSSSRQHSNEMVELDWSLAGGELLESVLAIQKLFSHDNDKREQWIHAQFLSTLCTYVVQGRPMQNTNRIEKGVMAMDYHVQEILHYALDDSKLIFVLSSILRAQSLYPQYSGLCSALIQTLEKFAKNGSWIKSRF